MDNKLAKEFSFSRTVLFLVGAICLLPLMLHRNGIWISVLIAELLGLIVAIYYFIKNENMVMCNKYNMAA